MLRLISCTVACCAAICAPLSFAVRAETTISAEPLVPTQPIRFARIPPEPMPLPPVDGQATEVLTLASAEAMAQASHPALRQADGLVRAARGEWLQVGLRPNPQIGYVGDEIGDEGRAGMQGGFFSQEFVTAGKLGLSRAVALREVAAAEQRLERARRQIVTTVRMYYYELLAAERSLALANQLQQVGSQALEASALRLKAQEGTQASVLQSRVEADSAQLLVEQATYRRDAARLRLNSVIGSESVSTRPLEDIFATSLPPLDWETLRAKLLSENPELSELRFSVDRARWAVDRAVAGRTPNVMVMSGAQYDNATQFAMANVQVSVPIPVFNRNQGGIAQAYGELTAAQSALEARELALAQQLAAAMSDYNNSSRRVAKYSESILPAARQSLELISSAYEQGELEYLDILATQRTYTEKNLDYINNLESAWKKWAEIDGLLVGPLGDAGN
jgi:outer membrane protein, heavy metal efflux system